MKCQNCRYDNPASARFCQNCGTRLATERPRLRTHLPRPGTLSQQLTSERRIVTILFADVAGSTALAELLDPEDWTEIMGGAFEYLISAVTRYEGTVARLMGDAILALFGAPVAHEDDPFRAVRAGLDIIEDLRPYQQETRRRLMEGGLQIDPSDFEVRLGINTGLVVVGSVGTGEMSEYTAMGDAVNVAARMEQTAQPGTVQIAQDTYRQVAALIESESLGGIEVKGKREPVPSYRVIGLKKRPGRQRGIEGADTPLIGREREMSLLRGTLIDLGQGYGQIVSVIGEAGLGKSRLTRELNLEVNNSQLDVSWIEVASLSFEGGQPYGLVQHLMRELLGAEMDGPADVVRQKIGELSESVEQEARPQVRRALEALYGLDASDGRTRPEGESLKRDIFAGTAALWRARARQGPIILVFDDLHWADPASVELIRDMLPLAWVAPVLFLCVFRPDRDSVVWQIPQAAQADDIVRYLEITLNPLTPEESTALAGSLLAFSDVPDKVARLVLEKAEGIPFFVEEIVRELIESGVLVPIESGGWRLESELDDIHVPENLEALLVTRMDRLPRSVRRTLQRASVIGRTFDYRILRKISRNPELLDDNLDVLVQTGLIRDSSRDSERRFTFHHALTQQAIHDTILLSRRRAFHRQTGEAIERLFPDQLAENSAFLADHFQQAGEFARALKYFRMAAEYAVNRLYANSEGAAHYGSAIETAEAADMDDTTLAELRRKRGLLYATMGDFDRALADLEEALALAQSANERHREWQALLDLGELWASRDYERTGEYFRQALDLARESGDLSSLASSLNRVGNWHVNVERPEEGMGYHREAREIFEQLGDRAGAAGTLDLMGIANLIGGDLVAADGYYSRAINLFRELEDHKGLVSSLTAAGLSGGSAGNVGTSYPATSLSEGINRGLQALALAEKIGWPAGESFAMWSLAHNYGAQGRFTQALEYGREALKVAADIEHHQWMAGSHDSLGNLFIELLDMKKAREHLREAVRLAHEIGSQYWIRASRAGLASTFLSDDLAEAKAILDVAIESDTPYRTSGQRSCWLARAKVALADGRPGRALEIADRLIESEPNLRPGQVITNLWLLRGDALTALGRTDEAERPYLAGIENARARGERARLWQLQIGLGRLYQATGRTPDADKFFAKAVTLIETLADTVPEKGLRENFLRRAKAMAACDSGTHGGASGGAHGGAHGGAYGVNISE